MFSVQAKELAEFNLDNETLTVTNTENTKYTKTIQILIGNTVGTQSPNLNVGESVTYKLIAPEGLYNIKISDGQTTITRNEVSLAETGKAIGALDKRTFKRSHITGDISPDRDGEIALLNYMQQSKFVYVFILVIVGAFILIAIEKKYAKKA